jgi:hypothetical protein
MLQQGTLNNQGGGQESTLARAMLSKALQKTRSSHKRVDIRLAWVRALAGVLVSSANKRQDS